MYPSGGGGGGGVARVNNRHVDEHQTSLLSSMCRVFLKKLPFRRLLGLIGHRVVDSTVYVHESRGSLRSLWS